MQVTLRSHLPILSPDVHVPSASPKAQSPLGPLTRANAKAEDEGKDAAHGQVGHPGEGALQQRGGVRGRSASSQPPTPHPA